MQGSSPRTISRVRSRARLGDAAPGVLEWPDPLDTYRLFPRQWTWAGRGHPGVPSPPTPGTSLCPMEAPTCPRRLHGRGHRCPASHVMAGRSLPGPKARQESGPGSLGPDRGETGPKVPGLQGPVKTFTACAPPLPLRISSGAALAKSE